MLYKEAKWVSSWETCPCYVRLVWEERRPPRGGQKKIYMWAILYSTGRVSPKSQCCSLKRNGGDAALMKRGDTTMKGSVGLIRAAVEPAREDI